MSNSEDIISKNQNIPVTPEPVFVASTKLEVQKIFRKNALAEAMEPVLEMLAKLGISGGTDGMQFARMIDARNQQITGEILRREAANNPNYVLPSSQVGSNRSVSANDGSYNNTLKDAGPPKAA